MAKKITMRKWVSLLITGAILWTFTCSCSKQPKYRPGGPYYYKSWANYYQPYRPIDEIQIDEGKELEGKVMRIILLSSMKMVLSGPSKSDTKGK
jgi:hypothetical protein